MTEREKRLQISDFTVGQKAYIYYEHIGTTRPPEIIETTVSKVGKKYVTVTRYDKKFKRHGDIEGLIEHSDYGELGILFSTKEGAEIEMKRKTLIHNIRVYSQYLYKCNYEELRTIMDMMKAGADR